MHGHNHPELANKLNDKIPNTVDEMLGRVRAFIKGEVATGITQVVTAPQWDKEGLMNSLGQPCTTAYAMLASVRGQGINALWM
ncbi:hypothetical protein Tco_0403806 [Tanacetum coccineum]